MIKKKQKEKIMISDFKNFIETHTANEPLFKNKKLLYTYRSSWLKLFDKVISEPLEEELIFRFNQCFVIPVRITESCKIDIQFDINLLLTKLETLNLPIFKILTNQFILNTPDNFETLFRYNKLFGYMVDYSFDSVSTEPIIVFYSDFTRNFVLDGNHRVDYAIRNQQDFIYAYVLSIKLLATSPHLFVDRVSYLLFCFLEDVAHLRKVLYDRQQKGLFGKIKTESSLLKQYSILQVVQAYISDTYQQN